MSENTINFNVDLRKNDVILLLDVVVPYCSFDKRGVTVQFIFGCGVLLLIYLVIGIVVAATVLFFAISGLILAGIIYVIYKLVTWIFKK